MRIAMSGLNVGQEIGAYTIEAHIASGGMGGVYRARHRTMDRVAALKTLLPHHADDAAIIERLRREARSIAALRHPNIVEIYDAQFETHPYFIAMAYAPNGTLFARLRELRKQHARMDEREAIDIARQIASGLAYAHRAGIIHRDIKPSNILIDADGRCVVSDFGIAVRNSDQTRLTEDFAAMGTPDYTSPEQARGEKPDARTDIYALGTLLYEMLAGNAPYASDTPWTVINKHMTAPPPDLLEARPNATPALRDVIVKAMAKNPADRFPSCDALLAALDAIREGRDPRLSPAAASEPTLAFSASKATVASAPAASRNAVSPMVLLSAAGLIVGLLGVGIAIYALLSTRAPQTPVAQATTVAPKEISAPTTPATSRPELIAASTATALPAAPTPTAPLQPTLDTITTARNRANDVADDDFVNGWEDWSWGGTLVSFVADVPSHSGNRYIRAKFKEQFGGLQFGRANPVSLDGVSEIEFFVRASDDGPVSFQVELSDNQTILGRSDTISISDPLSWQRVAVSIGQTNTQISQIKLIAMDEALNRNFYVDAVRLVRTAPQASSEGGCGVGLTREVWLNNSGSAIKEIPVSRAPDVVDIVIMLESLRTGEYFSERLSGYICAPRDGDYVFSIASDDSSELWLSTDASQDSLRRIAEVKLWTRQRQWDKEPGQRSTPIKLRGGQRYFVQVLHKQGEQGSHVAVAWEGPDIPLSVIGTGALAPLPRK
jgi:serine/threonine-protein kinase